MDLGLQGKTALITGASSGIGLAIARRLGREGCTVAVCGRAAAKLDEALASLRSDGVSCYAIQADLGDVTEVARLSREAVAALGRVDIVVSNAGTHVQGRLEEIETARLEHHLREKVLGPWELARQLVPHMRRNHGGRFILIIGQAGKVPGERVIASAVSNAAQHALVKSLSDDLARDGILVNAVCPSRIATPLTDGLTLANELHLGRSLEQQESGWGGAVPLGRFGEPDDIANAVAFVASGRAGFIVGSNIDVDGGYQRSIL